MQINSLSPEALLLLALSQSLTPTQAMTAWCAEYARVHGVSENAAKTEYWLITMGMEAR